jgi:hypothetical protein
MVSTTYDYFTKRRRTKNTTAPAMSSETDASAVIPASLPVSGRASGVGVGVEQPSVEKASDQLLFPPPE